MAQVQTFRDLQITTSEIAIRKIGVRDLWQSLKEGYDDFNAKPSFGVFLIIIYPLFALLLTLLLVSDNLLYLAFPMLAGFTLLGPLVSTCLCEMSRHRENGLEVSWHNSLDFVHSAAFAPIAALSVLLMVLYVAWLFMAQYIFFGTFGTDAPASFSAFMDELFSTRRGFALVMYGNGVGFLFAFTVLAISAISFPLLLDKPVSSATAIATSIRAVLANPLVMAVWGLIVVGLLIAGSVVFLIGLAAVLPILGHASWHLYRKLVEA